MSRGRGRGRGRGRPFGNMEGIGIGPSDAAPPPILQPPPLFPILERKPLEMKIDASSEYLYSVKQELQLFMKQSPFYVKADSDKPSIERYSDKYKEVKNGGLFELTWTPEWDYFPAELQPKNRKKKKSKQSSNVSNPSRVKKSKKRKLEEVVGEADSQPSKKKKVTFNESGLEESVPERPKEDITKKLSELEKSEASEEEASAEEELDNEEHYDEEIEEEGTDYNLTYFDNGEEDVEDDLEENEGPYY